ncbi:MAG TPA: hypothetical protein VMU81_04690 [Acetobacteraceae bacterium]|nr:hypothetical protein [Acetobacteraceae bacterium]
MSSQRKTLLAALAFLVPAAALIAAPASAATQPIHQAKPHAVHKVSTQHVAHKASPHHAIHKVSTPHVVHKPVHKTTS